MLMPTNCVFADGNLAYAAERVHNMIRSIQEDRADMTLGYRISGDHYLKENKRSFHNFSNPPRS